jgi:predicted acylesterase/phospholipase RssA
VHINLHEIDPEDRLFIASAVVGSSSIPFMFPPRNMTQFGLDYLMIDGGTTWNNNMISGI